MRGLIRLSILPAFLAAASCGGPEGGAAPALTVDATAVSLPAGTYVAQPIAVGIQNPGDLAILAPLCGTGPIKHASAYRERLVDGMWTLNSAVTVCDLRGATEVVSVPPSGSTQLLSMVVPNTAGTYRFHWTVPTNGGAPVDLISPAITVTLTP